MVRVRPSLPWCFLLALPVAYEITMLRAVRCFVVGNSPTLFPTSPEQLFSFWSLLAATWGVVLVNRLVPGRWLSVFLGSAAGLAVFWLMFGPKTWLGLSLCITGVVLGFLLSFISRVDEYAMVQSRPEPTAARSRRTKWHWRAVGLLVAIVGLAFILNLLLHWLTLYAPQLSAPIFGTQNPEPALLVLAKHMHTNDILWYGGLAPAGLILINLGLRRWVGLRWEAHVQLIVPVSRMLLDCPSQVLPLIVSITSIALQLVVLKLLWSPTQMGPSQSVEISSGRQEAAPIG